MQKYNDFNVFSDTIPVDPKQPISNILVYLPEGKVDTSVKKPAFIFLTGAGESKGGVEKLTVWGPFSFISKNWQPSFICIAIQNLTWQKQSMIDSVYAELKKRYNFGEIILSGLSEGGYGTMKEMATYPDTPLSKDVRAIIPMSASEAQHPDGVAGIIRAGIPVWSFGDDPGDTHGIYAHKDFINLQQLNPSGNYIWTRTTDGHGGWNKQYNPSYKGTEGTTKGLSIYEWSMQYAGQSVDTTTPPLPPVEERKLITTIKVYDNGDVETIK